MVILNQNKNEYIFSENIISIKVVGVKENPDTLAIAAIDTHAQEHILGVYNKTEISSVFADIGNSYSKYGTVQNGLGNIEQIVVVPIVHIMPDSKKENNTNETENNN